MRYAVLLYQDERVWTEATAEQREAYHAAHRAFDEAARARAEVYGGEALTSMVNATTLRHDTDGNRLVTDGPFGDHRAAGRVLPGRGTRPRHADGPVRPVAARVHDRDAAGRGHEQRRGLAGRRPDVTAA